MNPSADPVQLSRAMIPYSEEYYDLLRYEFDAFGAYRLRPEQRLPHVTINAEGYRGRLFSGRERVLFLGDSVTFGIGVSGDEERLPRYLELRSGLGVADASVRAYRLFQHFTHLPQLFHRLPEIETVILWFGYADLLFWTTTGGCVEGAFQFEHKYRGESESRRWMRLLLGRNAQAGSKTPADNRRKGSHRELAEEIVLYLRAVRDLCAARNIRLIWLIQPFLRTRPSAPELQRLMDLYHHKTQEKCGQGWYELAPAFVQALLESMKREGLASLPGWDSQSWIEENDFWDQVHLKESAQKRMAERLAQTVIPHMQSV